MLTKKCARKRPSEYAPGGTRTPGLSVNSRTSLPTELQELVYSQRASLEFGGFAPRLFCQRPRRDSILAQKPKRGCPARSRDSASVLQNFKFRPKENCRLGSRGGGPLAFPCVCHCVIHLSDCEGGNHMPTTSEKPSKPLGNRTPTKYTPEQARGKHITTK